MASKKGEYVKFKNYERKIKSPFIIHTDFESICANNIGILVNNVLGIKIFNPTPVIILFQKFNFILLEIFPAGSKFTFSSPSRAGIVGKSSSIKSRVNFQVYLEHLSFSSDLLKDY